MDHQTCHPKAWGHLSCAQFERLPSGWRAQVREVLGPDIGRLILAQRGKQDTLDSPPASRVSCRELLDGEWIAHRVP